MARDALAVLWRLRDAAVTQATDDLAKARAAAGADAQRLDDHRQTMTCEQAALDATQIADFANWLPHARQQADRLRGVLVSQEARVERFQQILVARRTDAEAVAKAMQRRAEETNLSRSRREQAVMDEVAGRRR